MMVILMVTSSCVVQESVITGSKRAYGYSWEQEVSIGNEVDKEIVAEFGIYEDNSLNEYIVNMSEEVLQNSHMRAEDTPAKYRETEFTFRILDSPVINAFALPGGFVYVTRGLMAHMNNEAQIAVVLGHEIGHVAARHASQRGFQQTVGQLVVIGGAVLGQELLGLPGETILNLSGQAAQLIFLSYSRSHERESDQLGVEYAAKTGFAAEEGAAFFTSLKRISDNSGQSLPNLLSTHPDPGERELQIPIMAEEWREKGFTQTVRNSEKYLDMIDGMIFGDNPRNGYEENSTFYHPEMKFRFPIPNGWQMVNQPSQVILISPEKDAVMILRLDSESATARESVQQFLQNNEVETSDQGSTTTNSGFPAYRADFTVTDGDNQLGVHLYALEYEGNIFRFLNYTELSKLDAYRSDFTTTTHAFDRLTDQRILNIKPVRLQVVRVANNRTFRDLLPQSLPMNITPEELAIVNQVYLDDVIEAGSYIKIPVQ
ncbi:MAG: M48 family metalloprotease [Balneolaceae bacterium]